MSRIWMPGGAGGADVDVVTAGPDDVLLGKVIVGPDGEPLTGVLVLDGTAADSQVLAGKTYYNTDAKTKRTGTMTNVAATEDAKGLNFDSDGKLYLRMTNGAHITNDSAGYPTVRIPWQDKTITPGASSQTASPDSNKVLRNVTVNAVSGLSAGNIKKGATVGGVAGTGVPSGYIGKDNSLINRQIFNKANINSHVNESLNIASYASTGRTIGGVVLELIYDSFTIGAAFLLAGESCYIENAGGSGKYSNGTLALSSDGKNITLSIYRDDSSIKILITLVRFLYSD